MAIAYVRISDSNKQDAASQRVAIQEYANEHGLVITKWVEEQISASKTDVADRELSKYINNGDTIIMTDATRLGRRKVFDLVGVIGGICKNGGELHFAYTGRRITEQNMDDAEVIFTVVGGSYAAVEESKVRSSRAKAAHAKRKADGLSVGRRKGAVVKSKLDAHAPDIQNWLADGIKKTVILKKLKEKDCIVSRNRLYTWMDQKGIKR